MGAQLNNRDWKRKPMKAIILFFSIALSHNDPGMPKRTFGQLINANPDVEMAPFVNFFQSLRPKNRRFPGAYASLTAPVRFHLGSIPQFFEIEPKLFFHLENN